MKITVLFADYTGVVYDIQKATGSLRRWGNGRQSFCRTTAILTVGSTVDEAAWFYYHGP